MATGGLSRNFCHQRGSVRRFSAWLLEQGLFVVAADPTELFAGLELGELRA